MRSLQTKSNAWERAPKIDKLLIKTPYCVRIQWESVMAEVFPFCDICRSKNHHLFQGNSLLPLPNSSLPPTQLITAPAQLISAPAQLTYACLTYFCSCATAHNRSCCVYSCVSTTAFTPMTIIFRHMTTLMTGWQSCRQKKTRPTHLYLHVWSRAWVTAFQVNIFSR